MKNDLHASLGFTQLKDANRQFSNSTF